MFEFFILALGFALIAAVRAHSLDLKDDDSLPYNVLCVVLIVVAAILSALTR